MNSYPTCVSLELSLISLLRDETLQSIFLPHMTPDLIVEDIARLAFLAILDARTSDLGFLLIHVQKRIKDAEIVSLISQAFQQYPVPLQPPVLAKAIRELEKYVRWRKVVTQVDLMASQNLNTIFPADSSKAHYDRLIEACTFHIDLDDDQGTFLFARQEDYERAKLQSIPLGKPISSGFRLINEAFQDCGYLPGSVTMVCAPPGVGKSTMLVSEGAAFTRQGVRVLHYVLGDLNALDVCHKYIANDLRKSIDSVRASSDEYWQMDRIQSMFSRLLLRVKAAFEFDAEELYYDALRWKEKFDFHCVLVDYDGNIRPSQNENLYTEGGYTYGLLERLSRKTESAVLVGCQPKHSYWAEEFIPLAAASESSRKQHHIDNMVTLSQPNKSVPVGVAYLPKVRRGESGGSSYLCYLNGYASILEIDHSEYQEIKKWFRSEQQPKKLLRDWARERHKFQ